MSQSVSIAILAAGLGTRMKSRKAKVLHEAGGMPVVEHVVRAAKEISGDPASIVTVVGHQADRVRAALAGHGIGFAEQTEQRGTGHALLMCREQLEAHGGLVIVLYGDTPLLTVATIRRLVDLVESSGASASVITTELADPHGYGRIVRTETGDVAAIVEQKAATAEQQKIREINSGIYCFRAGLLWPLLGALTPNPASGEIYLTDIVEALHARGERVVPMLLEDESELLGINTKVELATADRIFRERKNRQLMLDGVTIVKPETVTVDMDVEIGPDTVLEPFSFVLGKSKIGAECRVGAGAIIRDSTLEDGVVVEAYTFVGTSHLEAGVSAGPFARLRMANHVEAGAHIGNFVELKKTRMGAGAKAGHLAYLGDSTIGAEVNIGAGTITCNYDGRKKHETHIGKGSFVGSNSTLVAPIKIGNESYIAAGSTITQEVPVDTLALGRARQENKAGWPSRRRAQGK